MRILALLPLVLLAACDNAIQPLVEGAQTEFSVSGYLDTAADTQFVRLESVRPTGVSDRPPLEDVIVRSTDGSGDWQLFDRRQARSTMWRRLRTTET
jgi:hypothetical protein